MNMNHDNSDCVCLHSRRSTIAVLARQGEPLRLVHLGQRIDEPYLFEGQEYPELYPSVGIDMHRQDAFCISDPRTSERIPVQLLVAQVHNREDSLCLLLEDRDVGVSLSLQIHSFRASDLFSFQLSITNEADDPLVLEYASSLFLPLPFKTGTVTSFSGRWASEMHMHHTVLQTGTFSLAEQCGVRTTRYTNPSVIIGEGDRPAAEYSGTCIGAAVAHSGNYSIEIHAEAESQMLLRIAEPRMTSRRELQAGKTHTCPLVLLSHSDEGMTGLTHSFHSWAREEGLRDGKRERLTVLNSWEAAYFDFNEKTLKGLIDRAAECGIELFVLDDGWFGELYPRDDDSSSLGDWEVNPRKLPNGLCGLSEYCREKGLGFGLWVEPEMISRASRLYERHPEWVFASDRLVATEERNQLLLDLSRREVIAFIKEVFSSLLVPENGISYIKWDCNRHVHSLSGPPEVLEGYIRGYYEILSWLESSYPLVTIQNCASGGGRVEYGALSRTHEFWTSDCTDAHNRIYMQWGSSHFYPPYVAASHVSSTPNHITGRSIPMKFRCDVAMAGRMGIEMDPAGATDRELAILKQAVSDYKSIRHILTEGDFYRLCSPYGNEYTASMFSTEREAVLFIYCIDYRPGDWRAPLRLRGLLDDTTYRIRELNRTDSERHMMNLSKRMTADGASFRGEVLRIEGLPIAFSGQYESRVYHLY